MATPVSSVATHRNLQHAIRFPVAGWPSFGFLSSIGEHARSPDRPVFELDLNYISLNQTQSPWGSQRGSSSYLKVGGAILATPQDYRMSGAAGSFEVPLSTRDYEVWASAERRIQAGGKHGCGTRVRFGPNAS